MFQWSNHYTLSFCKVSLVILYQMLQHLACLRLQLRQKFKRNKKYDQLVKYKNTRAYLLLYIPEDYENTF